jgi:3-phenylpropionate/trans-cinnamate dioxygenase ferredoxin component
MEGKDIALFNVDAAVCAMDDGCLHHGVSLGTSELDGKLVTCRGHGWKYDVTTGNTLNVPGYGVAAYPVKVVDGKIMVATGGTLNPAA